jgi:NADPH2:quinone reductase
MALAFSTVNPADVKRRACARQGIEERPFDRVCPPSDGAGTVDAVGEGVDPNRLRKQV